MSYLDNKYHRSSIKPEDKALAFKGEDLIKAISNSSGYSKAAVKDILHYLSAVIGIKLKQNIPVLIEGIGLLKIKPAKYIYRLCPIKGVHDYMYKSRTVVLFPDKYLRNAVNTDQEGYRKDFSGDNEEPLVKQLKEYYNTTYGEVFEKLLEDKYGDIEELDSALKILSTANED